jgi:hypothetical protein
MNCCNPQSMVAPRLPRRPIHFRVGIPLKWLHAAEKNMRVSS